MDKDKNNSVAQSQINKLLIGIRDEEFREKYIYTDSEITETVIRRYLMRLKGIKNVPTLGSHIGDSALSPIKKPKTLDEAKKLTDIFINK